MQEANKEMYRDVQSVQPPRSGVLRTQKLRCPLLITNSLLLKASFKVSSRSEYNYGLVLPTA